MLTMLTDMNLTDPPRVCGHIFIRINCRALHRCPKAFAQLAGTGGGGTHRLVPTTPLPFRQALKHAPTPALCMHAIAPPRLREPATCASTDLTKCHQMGAHHIIGFASRLLWLLTQSD